MDGPKVSLSVFALGRTRPYNEIDQHFIKERLDNGSICITYIPSSQQIVNVLIKRLLKPNFNFCVSKLCLIDIYVPTWEGMLELVGLVLKSIYGKIMGRFTLFPKSFPFLSYCVLYLFSLIVSIIYQKIIKQQYRGFSPGNRVST